MCGVIQIGLDRRLVVRKLNSDLLGFLSDASQKKLSSKTSKILKHELRGVSKSTIFYGEVGFSQAEQHCVTQCTHVQLFVFH